jgi:hypothetical protein
VYKSVIALFSCCVISHAGADEEIDHLIRIAHVTDEKLNAWANINIIVITHNGPIDATGMSAIRSQQDTYYR